MSVNWSYDFRAATDFDVPADSDAVAVFIKIFFKNDDFAVIANLNRIANDGSFAADPGVALDNSFAENYTVINPTFFLEVFIGFDPASALSGFDMLCVYYIFDVYAFSRIVLSILAL